jgi:hypothetical protein
VRGDDPSGGSAQKQFVLLSAILVGLTANRMGKTVAAIALAPNQRLASQIRKEKSVRKQGDKYLAWIVEDKLARMLLLGQKLAPLADFINAQADVEGADRVSLSALYQITHSPDGPGRGGYSKHRWRVVPCELDRAACAFEAARARGYEHCVVLGDPSCYRVV